MKHQPIRTGPRRARARDDALSLVEFMIVIAMVAVILSFAIPSLSDSQAAGNESSAVAGIKNIVASSEQYAVVKGDYAPNMKTLITSGFLDDSWEPKSGEYLRRGFVFYYRIAGGGFVVIARRLSTENGNREFAYTTASGAVVSKGVILVRDMDDEEIWAPLD